MMEENVENLWLAEVWLENRDRLVRLLAARMPAVLLRRMSADDVAQETYLACGRRIAYLQACPELPIFVKLRKIALQTLTDIERRHLGAGKRDAMKESLPSDSQSDATMDAWAAFADTISSPRTHLEKIERQALARRVLNGLPQHDREILELRHFEELSNTECAAVLGIAPKAASIRYVRALKRFRDLLQNVEL